jgi:hypothetical protein
MDGYRTMAVYGLVDCDGDMCVVFDDEEMAISDAEEVGCQKCDVKELTLYIKNDS